jgi:hypothetical protein
VGSAGRRCCGGAPASRCGIWLSAACCGAASCTTMSA